MSKQYYVVSEEELEELAEQVGLDVAYGCPITRRKAEDACRARPVPEWAEEFTGPIDPASEYGPDVHYSIHRRMQEIKR